MSQRKKTAPDLIFSFVASLFRLKVFVCIRHALGTRATTPHWVLGPRRPRVPERKGISFRCFICGLHFPSLSRFLAHDAPMSVNIDSQGQQLAEEALAGQPSPDVFLNQQHQVILSSCFCNCFSCTLSSDIATEQQSFNVIVISANSRLAVNFAAF